MRTHQLDAADRFALAADLGTDQVMIYQYDSAERIAPTESADACRHVPPGSGPRHFAFHPTGKFGYVINELNSTVIAFAYDGQRGELKAIQEVSTLPADFRGENSTAEIAVSPDGKFVYGSNRGHHSIVVYAIDEQSGKLTLVSHHSTLGEQPRNFAIDPTGTYLLAANQRTNNVVVFRVDPATGKTHSDWTAAEDPRAGLRDVSGPVGRTIMRHTPPAPGVLTFVA